MSKFIPNSFQVPNAFVDEFLERISGNATKCYLVVARKTTGWQKVSDRISTDQFMKICGIKDVKTAYKALSELADVKLINVFKKQGEINEFERCYSALINAATQSIFKGCNDEQILDRLYAFFY